MTNLAALLTPDDLATLSRAAGGTKLYIPKHYGKPPNGGRDTSPRLLALVDEPLAVLLVFHFGDSVIYIPKAKDAPPVDRTKLKRLARNRSLSTPEIARKANCTERTVEKHRAKHCNG